MKRTLAAGALTLMLIGGGTSVAFAQTTPAVPDCGTLTPTEVTQLQTMVANKTITAAGQTATLKPDLGSADLLCTHTVVAADLTPVTSPTNTTTTTPPAPTTTTTTNPTTTTTTTAPPIQTTTTTAPVPTKLDVDRVSGNAQSAAVNTAYAAPLVVKVTDSKGVPVAGVGVTFTANPASSANGASVKFSNGTNTITITTDAQGVASTGTFSANGDVGTVKVATTSGNNARRDREATFTLKNTAAPVSPTTPTNPTTTPTTPVTPPAPVVPPAAQVAPTTLADCGPLDSLHLHAIQFLLAHKINQVGDTVQLYTDLTRTKICTHTITAADAKTDPATQQIPGVQVQVPAGGVDTGDGSTE